MRPTRAMRHTSQRQPRRHHYTPRDKSGPITAKNAEYALKQAGWREMAVEQDIDRLNALERQHEFNIPKILLRQAARTKSGGKVFIPPQQDGEGSFMEVAQALRARATKKNRRKLQKHQHKDEHGRFISRKERLKSLDLEETQPLEEIPASPQNEKSAIAEGSHEVNMRELLEAAFARAAEESKATTGLTECSQDQTVREALEAAFGMAAKPKRKHTPARHCKDVRNKRKRPPQIVIPDVKGKGKGHLPPKCARRLIGKIKNHTLTHPGTP